MTTIRKPKDDSLVYCILIALCRGNTALVLDDYSIKIKYKSGRLSITSPYEYLLSRMFDLNTSRVIVVDEDTTIYEQEYLLQDQLSKYEDDLLGLKKYYEESYL